MGTDVCLNRRERDPREEVPNKGIIEPNRQCSLIVSISQAIYGLAPRQLSIPQMGNPRKQGVISRINIYCTHLPIVRTAIHASVTLFHDDLIS
jgi:hypothetical protein